MENFKPTKYSLTCVATGREFEDAGWTLDDMECKTPSLVRTKYEKKQIEVGFSIERASWGKGYAAEALRAVLEYLTVQEGLARVTAWCASDNIASKRTLEKAGMRLSGIDAGGLEVDGQRYDKLDYTYSDQESE